jgi:outer membrane protein assembly factor BamB
VTLRGSGPRDLPGTADPLHLWLVNRPGSAGLGSFLPGIQASGHPGIRGGSASKPGSLYPAWTGDSQGRLLVLDAASGEEIWQYRLGGQIAMPPITYLYKGSQEVAVISGGALFVLSLVD